MNPVEGVLAVAVVVAAFATPSADREGGVSVTEGRRFGLSGR
jgi:hypothetical protein